jgi:hypothetical protein
MAEVLCKTAVLLNASEWCAEREQEEAAAALVGCRKDSNYDDSSFSQNNNDNSSNTHSSSGQYDDLQGSIELAPPSEGTNGADALIAAIAACSTPSVYYNSSSAGQQHSGSSPQYEHYDPTDPFAVRVKQEHSSETASNSASASASASESPRLGSSSPHYYEQQQQHQQQGGGAVAPKLLGGLLDSLVSFASQELMIMKDDDERSDEQQSHSQSPERRSGSSSSSSAAAAAAGAAAPSGRGAHRQLPQTYHDDGTPRVRYNRPRSISNPEGMDNASWRGVNGGRGNVTSSDYNLRGHQYNYLTRGADIAVIKVSAQRSVWCTSPCMA